jgi:hypothetical protein
MPMYAVIEASGVINWSRDSDLSGVTRESVGYYFLNFSADCSKDVFVFHAKVEGPKGHGCDAPNVVISSIQDGARRICVSVTNIYSAEARVDAQFSYIRYRKADEF